MSEARKADTNKVRWGLSNLYYALFSKTSLPDAPAWDKPVKVPGAVGFSPEAQSEEYTFYADNMAYFSTYSSGSYAAELDMAIFPDDMLADIFGWLFDAIGGMIERQGGEKRDFAVMGQFEGDKSGRRWVYYNTTAGIPSETGATTEGTVNIQPQKMKITMNPLSFGNDKVATRYSLVKNADIEGNAEVYDNFFNAVYIPTDLRAPSPTEPTEPTEPEQEGAA